MNRRRALLFTTTAILALCGAWGVGLRVQRQQYARNRQVIDALIHGDTKTALTLINAGADPNTRLAPPSAPAFKLLLDYLLHRKRVPKNDSPTAFMLACGDDYYPQGDSSRTTIFVSESLPLLRAMLAHGANVNTRGWHDGMALHYAANKGREHTVELLLYNEADVNARDTSGYTPLMLSLGDHNLNTVRLLLSHGANPNVQNVNGDTALHNAVSHSGTERTIAELLSHGATPYLRNKNGYTPFGLAQRFRSNEVVELLLHAGKNAPPAANHR